MLLASCGQNTITDGEAARSDRQTLAFGYYAAGSASTRAQKETFVDGVTNLTIPKGQKVGIFGYYQGQDDWTPKKFTADFMYNQPLVAGESVNVTETESGTSKSIVRCSLSYDNEADKKYWPNTEGDKLAFIAYYPWNEAPADDKLSSLDTYIQPVFTKGGIGAFRFKVAGKAENQLDFMVSDSVVNRTRPLISGNVPLTFHHALSAITSSVTMAQDLIAAGAKITNVSFALTGVRSRGTCHPKVDKNGKMSFIWDDLTTDASFQVAPPSDENTEAERVLLIIPQPLTTAELTVTYDIEFHETGTDGKDYVSYSYRGNTAAFKLSETSGTAGTPVWRAGLRYNYNVIVSLTGINFLPSIRQWTTGTMETDLDPSTP